MRRHELDPVSLVFGLLFLMASAGYLLSHTTSLHFHWLIVAPVALIAIGIAVLAVTISRIQQADRPPVDDATETPTSLS